ncbi:MAG: response regulator transcription factor [Pseudomonadota bacterium]
MPHIQQQFLQQADRGARILIVDDHPIVGAGLRRLLHDAGWLDVHYTSSFARAFRRCRRFRPDAVVIDLATSAGALTGLSFVRRLRRYDRNIPVLVLTMHNDPIVAREALRTGANGYVVKDTSPEEIVQGVTAALDGHPYVSRMLASDLAFLKVRQPAASALDALSSRERHVLSMLAEGKTYSQIANNLALSYKAVAHICNRLKPKLGVRSLQELTHFAVQNLPTAPSGRRVRAKRS